MFRRMSLVALVGVGTAMGLASKSFAQSPPKVPQPDYLQKGLKLPNPDSRQKRLGLQVTMVLPMSPAAMQNIEVGDIIVTANGMPVSSLMELNLMLGQGGHVGYLQVLDGGTGWLEDVIVYPVRGKIGVHVRPVSLGPRPFVPGLRPFTPPPFPPDVLPFPPRPFGPDIRPFPPRPFPSPIGIGGQPGE